MFQFISQCKLCDIHDEAIGPHNHNLIILGRVLLGNVAYQISNLWAFFFLVHVRIFFNVFSK